MAQTVLISATIVLFVIGIGVLIWSTRSRVWKNVSLFCFAIALAIALAPIWSVPVQSQIIDIPEELVQQGNTDISREGYIDVATVRLDGQDVIEVGAPTPNNLGNDNNSITPIDLRVRKITFHLKNILKTGFDPDTFVVQPGTLNNQTVILASDIDWEPQLIATVTQEDVDISTHTSIEAVAEKWSQAIRNALLQAQAERQPGYQRAQVPYILQTLMIMIIGSLLVLALQKFRWARHLHLKEKKQMLDKTTSSIPDISEPSSQTDSSSVEDAGQESVRSHRRRGRFSRWMPQLSLDNQEALNTLVNPLLLAAQISLWFIGFSAILSRFPQTRALANWLLRLPLSLMAVILGIALIKQVADFVGQLLLNQWKRRVEEYGVTNNRLLLRIQTFMTVIKELNTTVLALLSILLFFYLINALQIGLISLVAIAFLLKSELSNHIKTYFILRNDEYALGDIISLESASGKDIAGIVEYMSLRTTKIRNLEGELITVSNGDVNSITNRSHLWAQVNMGVDVAYNTDLKQAIAIIEQIAQEMHHDPLWSDQILDDPAMLGVDNFGDNSITIRILIKTSPGQQWNVAREYRLRLKVALDQAGISIPFPQRSIWFENSLPEKN